MSARDITIQAADGGEFAAYLATPSAGEAPGIVVIQEIFGVNEVMRSLADWLAEEGFAALCPDLFWRQEPGIQITDRTDAEWARAFELLQGFDVDKGVDDIASTIDALRGSDACSGKIGAVGGSASAAGSPSSRRPGRPWTPPSGTTGSPSAAT